jgi:hypothetical protein
MEVKPVEKKDTGFGTHTFKPNLLHSTRTKIFSELS